MPQQKIPGRVGPIAITPSRIAACPAGGRPAITQPRPGRRHGAARAAADEADEADAGEAGEADEGGESDAADRPVPVDAGSGRPDRDDEGIGAGDEGPGGVAGGEGLDTKAATEGKRKPGRSPDASVSGLVG